MSIHYWLKRLLLGVLVIAVVGTLWTYRGHDPGGSGSNSNGASGVLTGLSASSSTRIGALRPLDTARMQASFNGLKRVLSRGSLTRYSKDTDRMLRHQLPMVNSSTWRLHSPQGYNYSHAELLALGNDGLVVPNVAHFVLPFGDPQLQFHQLVCILSCAWVMRPRLIYFWYVRQPEGEHWNALRRNLSAAGRWDTGVVLAHRQQPFTVYGLPVHTREHQSDVMRIEAVLTFGGAYFDLDVITLKPLTTLRQYNFTIGRQSPDGLCNGAFLAAPNSTMLAAWHVAYQVFDGSIWSAHSVNLPHYMCASDTFRYMCHVEEDSMERPTWEKHERDWIYNVGGPRQWPWRKKNYVMHLWYRYHKVQYNMSSIGRVDSMLGDMFRFVLFGNATCCR